MQSIRFSRHRLTELEAPATPTAATESEHREDVASPGACAAIGQWVVWPGARASLDWDYLDAELTASRRRSLGSRHRASWQSGTEYMLDLESGKTQSAESNSRCDGSPNPFAHVHPHLPLLLALEWEMHAGPAQEATPPFARRLAPLNSSRIA